MKLRENIASKLEARRGAGLTENDDKCVVNCQCGYKKEEDRMVSTSEWKEMTTKPALND